MGTLAPRYPPFFPCQSLYKPSQGLVLTNTCYMYFPRGSSRASFLASPWLLPLSQQGLAAFLSNDLPDVPLTQHNCFFVSSGLALLVYGLGAAVTAKGYTTTTRKIPPNLTPSLEQLVSAVA